MSQFSCSLSERIDIQFSSIDANLIDLVWKDQPERQFNPIIILDSSTTGKKISDALVSIRKQMREKHSDVLVVTALDEVACKLCHFFPHCLV